MTEALTELGNRIALKRSDCVLSWSTSHGELSIEVVPAHLLSLVEYLKLDAGCKFTTLVDITAVDYPERTKRFDVVYHFLSMTENKRCRLTTSINESEEVQSITSVFECANWFEREIFDLFGIRFTSHPDLRRILTDYGFEGHPLRKDFPTSGFLEVRYDELEKRVVYEPTTLTQGYRDFDFLSPWENPDAYKNTKNKT